MCRGPGSTGGVDRAGGAGRRAAAGMGRAPTGGTQQGAAGTRHHVSLICPRDLSSPPSADSGTPPPAWASSGGSAPSSWLPECAGIPGAKGAPAPSQPCPGPTAPPRGLAIPGSPFCRWGARGTRPKSHSWSPRGPRLGAGLPLKDWLPHVALPGQLAPCDPLAPPARPGRGPPSLLTPAPEPGPSVSLCGGLQARPASVGADPPAARWA